MKPSRSNTPNLVKIRIAFIATIVACAVALCGNTRPLVAYAAPAQASPPTPGMTLFVDSHGRPVSPFKTSKSTIVPIGGPHVFGVPANALGAPVSVLACDATFHGTGTKAWSTLRFTVLNQTAFRLKYTRIAHRRQYGGAYSDAILFDLKPHEMRTFTLTDGDPVIGFAPGRYPQWMLCGAGPAQKADGSMLEFEPEFLK